MSETKVSRRPRGEDAIYFATAKNRYVGSVSLGYGPDGKRIRRKVLGKTKQEVRDRLKALRDELNAGVRTSSAYTVRDAVDDCLREGLDGTSERTRTLYEGLPEPVLEVIGAKPLRVLSARGRGLGAREMRHTFVSVLPANGVPVESIALLAGHERSATTESVYRHEIRLALTQGAEVMDKIFN